MAPTISTVDLVRSWLGQALRATGAAVVVPVAILVALSLTAIGGSGLGGLGSLSQIVSGPQAAGSDVTVDDGDTEITAAVTQLAAQGTGGTISSPPTGVGNAPVTTGPGGGGDLPGGQAPGPDGGNGPGGDGPGGDGIQPTPPSQPSPTPAPPGEAPSPQNPGVVDNLGQTVTDVTSGTPVGPTVEDAVDGLIEVCGRLGCP
jgi:hypothetical protein